MANRFEDTYIAECKNSIIELLHSITREGADIEGLISYLENSDYYEAPASSKWHNNTKGGLIDHSLNVYYNLCALVEIKEVEVDRDSLIICALLHDMAKIDYYEPDVRNVKKDGVWVQEPYYAVRDDSERLLYGNHEETSVYMVKRFIPLKVEEEIAILHHMGGKSFDSTGINLSPVWSRYPLVLLLHLADMMATFGDEGGWYDKQVCEEGVGETSEEV